MPVAFTKLESLHIGNVMAMRYRVESEGRARTSLRLGFPLMVLSIFGIGLVGVFAMALRPDPEQELVFSIDDGWTVQRDRSDWLDFVGEPDCQAQWTHVDGWVCFVFRYDINRLLSIESFHQEMCLAYEKSGHEIIMDDGRVPGPLTGFQTVVRMVGEDPASLYVLVYLLRNTTDGDIHQLVMTVREEELEEAQPLLGELTKSGGWVEVSSVRNS